MPGHRTLLAVHAHPDDECIRTGGMLARYAAEGVRTVLVTCTDGAVGEISDPSLATPENLAEVRSRELDESLRLLNVGDRCGLAIATRAWPTPPTTLIRAASCSLRLKRRSASPQACDFQTRL